MATRATRARLAGITLVVIAAHVALLSIAPPDVPVRIELARPLATRQIMATPPPPPAAPPAPAPRRAARAAQAPVAESRPASTPPATTSSPALASTAPVHNEVAAQSQSQSQSQPAPQPPRSSAGGSDVELGPMTPPRVASSREPGAPGDTQSRRIALPAPARLNYEVVFEKSGLSLVGAARLQWSHDSRSYTARLEVDVPLGRTRMQESRGRITPDGLAPQRFADRNRNEEATHFERDKGKLVFSNNRPEADLQDGMQDRLSVIVQVASMIGGDPARFPAGTQIAIPTAGTRDAETWTFLVEGEEDLQLPGGDLRALRISRAPRKEYDQKVELWLAPRLDYAPVRVRLTAPNGDSVDQRWASTDKG